MMDRIQRKRTKGWRLPDNAVIVTRPTKWGNPFKVGSEVGDVPHFIVREAGYWSEPATKKITPGMAKEMYRVWINRQIDEKPERYRLSELRGKDLACWCKPGEPCHGDVLIALANP